MHNILVISTDEKAAHLVEDFQLLVNARIELIDNFDLGLKEVFDKRPVLVFIQREIAGVAGETVAKHFKGLLREEAPKAILMRDAASARLGEKSSCDGSIDISLPDDELKEAFRECLAEIPGLHWFDTAAPEAKENIAPPLPEWESPDFFDNSVAVAAGTSKPEGRVPPETSAEIDMALLTEQTATPPALPAATPPAEGEDLPVSKPETAPPPPPTAPLPPETAKTPLLPAGATEKPLPAVTKPEASVNARGESAVVAVPTAADKPVPELRPAKQAGSRVAEAPAQGTAKSGKQGPLPDKVPDKVEEEYDPFELPPFESRFVRQPAAGVRLWKLLLGVTLASLLAFGIYQLMPRVQGNRVAIPAKKPEPVPPRQAAATSADIATSGLRLPVSIPTERPDPAYAAAHPGWQRYQSIDMEYQVFRENDLVRAIRVIANHQGVVSKDFIQLFLQESCGSPAMRLLDSSERQGVRIERLAVTENTELILYRNQTSGPIRAFVLSVN